MSRTVKLFIGAGGLAILASLALVVVLATGTVLAQTPPAGGQAPNTATTPQGPLESFLSKLAARLGIGEDALKSAIKDTSSQMVDEAQQQGKITKEQADALRQRIQDSPYGFGFFGRGGPRMKGGAGRGIERGQVISDAAQILNMSASDIQTQLQSGKSLADVAASKNVSRDSLVSQLAQKAGDRIQERVKAGQLTEAQGSQLTSNLQQAIGQVVDGALMGHGFRGKLGQRDGQSPQTQGQQQQRFLPQGMPFSGGI